MREMKLGGTCAVCGDSQNDGAFWHTTAKILDFNVAGVPPIEPDMTEPERCDACEKPAREIAIRQSIGRMRRTEEMIRRKLAERGGEGNE